MGEGAAVVTTGHSDSHRITRLFLVRHGESEWNRSSRYAGQQDVPLSELGQRQGERVAQRLAGERPTAIYTSPLERAKETAAIIGQVTGCPVTLEPDLAEINHGLWEGLTASEVRETFGSDYVRWRSQPHTMIMPRGESLAEVEARAQAALHRILAEQPNGRVVVCSHDAVLRVLVLGCLRFPLEHFWCWSFQNASVSILETGDEYASAPFRLVHLNDTAHLGGLCSEQTAQAL